VRCVCVLSSATCNKN